MILYDSLKETVRSQMNDLLSKDKGITRQLSEKVDLSLPYASVITGIRRCGKSTLLRQLIEKNKKFYYLNFEDTRLSNFELSDFQKLNEVFKELYGDCNLYVFDEVQNVNNWEKYVREMLDKNNRFLITGSNASLLSKELGTKLTGRHISYELLPFDFFEFIRFFPRLSEKTAYDHYSLNGGFPEYLKYNRVEILQELFKDILFRDIVVRYGIRETKVLQDLAQYLLSNIGKEFSYNNLKKMYNLGSVNSVISFVKYLEDSYLMFTVPRFDYSLKKQQIYNKKVYAIDVGLARFNSESWSMDHGRVSENIVYLHLRKKYKNIFYYKGKHECDFVVKEGRNITNTLQVCYTLNEDNYKRELDGLIEAMNTFNLKEGYILTTSEKEEEILVDNKRVFVKCIRKWLLEK